MSINFGKSLSLTAAILSATMIIAPVNSAKAEINNPNISITKSELKAKCKRSGGVWTEEENGTYRCVVNNPGSDTIVECTNGKCEGSIIDDDDYETLRRPHRLFTRFHATTNVMRVNR
ncbi:MAG: hypothetical protein LJE68_17065 [Rhodobacter sp.]|nr:hypothetical protein [Rhodobacter sp.]